MPSTALVESRFSLTTMMKSSHQSLLSLERLRGMMLMKDELPFASDELCFVELCPGCSNKASSSKYGADAGTTPLRRSAERDKGRCTKQAPSTFKPGDS